MNLNGLIMQYLAHHILNPPFKPLKKCPINHRSSLCHNSYKTPLKFISTLHSPIHYNCIRPPLQRIRQQRRPDDDTRHPVVPLIQPFHPGQQALALEELQLSGPDQIGNKDWMGLGTAECGPDLL